MNFFCVGRVHYRKDLVHILDTKKKSQIFRKVPQWRSLLYERFLLYHYCYLDIEFIYGFWGLLYYIPILLHDIFYIQINCKSDHLVFFHSLKLSV